MLFKLKIVIKSSKIISKNKKNKNKMIWFIIIAEKVRSFDMYLLKKSIPRKKFFSQVLFGIHFLRYFFKNILPIPIFKYILFFLSTDKNRKNK